MNKKQITLIQLAVLSLVIALGRPLIRMHCFNKVAKAIDSFLFSYYYYVLSYAHKTQLS